MAKRKRKPNKQRRGARLGRNDPCPCGSGRKAKKCCGPASADAEATHQLDHRCVQDVLRAASEHFGADLVGEVLQDIPGDIEEEGYLQLHMVYAAYHGAIDNLRLVDWYVLAHGAELPEGTRSWLEAQQRSWVSIWEVLGVKRGAGIELRDLLTGEERYVHEVLASQSMSLGRRICARVVDHAGISLLCGMHPRSRSPLEAEGIVEAFSGERDEDEGPVSQETLRGDDSYLLLELWEEDYELERRQAPASLRLQNTDGDPLLMTTDHFALSAEADKVLARLVALPGYETDGGQDEEGAVLVHVLRRAAGASPGLGMTLLGRVRILDETLALETNSLERADSLCDQIEDACEGLLQHVEREHTDLPTGLPGAPGMTGPGLVQGEEGSPEREAQFERLIKEGHYARWPEVAVPALGGLTPRQAAKAGGEAREQLEVLLQEFEHMEAKLPRGRRYDISRLRLSLGMTR